MVTVVDKFFEISDWKYSTASITPRCSRISAESSRLLPFSKKENQESGLRPVGQAENEVGS